MKLLYRHPTVRMALLVAGIPAIATPLPSSRSEDWNSLLSSRAKASPMLKSVELGWGATRTTVHGRRDITTRNDTVVLSLPPDVLCRSTISEGAIQSHTGEAEANTPVFEKVVASCCAFAALTDTGQF